MNNLEIRKIASAIYWKETVDLSNYSDDEIQEIMEDVSLVRNIEDKANEIVERRQVGDLPDWGRFCYGL